MAARVTEEEALAMADAYERGTYVRTIAAQFGRSKETVRAHLDRLDTPRRRKVVTGRRSMTEREAFCGSIAAALIETLPPDLRAEAAAMLGD